MKAVIVGGSRSRSFIPISFEFLRNIIMESTDVAHYRAEHLRTSREVQEVCSNIIGLLVGILEELVWQER